MAKTEDFGGEAAWTDNQYKLIVGKPRRGGSRGNREPQSMNEQRVELYDLSKDPQESIDIAAKHPEIVHQMTVQLHRWQRSVERSLSGADYTN